MRDGVRIFLAFLITAAVIAVFALFLGFYMKSNKEKEQTEVNIGTESTIAIDEIVRHTATPSPTPQPTQEPVATPAVKPEITVLSTDTTAITMTWAGYEESYLLRYRKDGETIYFTNEVKGTSATLTGLEPATKYELTIGKKAIVDSKGWHEASENEEINSQFSDVLAFETASTGYGDPFAGVYGILVIGAEERTVAVTSEDGVMAAKAWPQFDTNLFGDPELKNFAYRIDAGTEMKIVMRNEKYCFLREDGHYSVYVTNGSGTAGWVDAEDMLINVAGVFSPENKNYAIKIKRTNAYSSLITAGGAAHKIDSSSTPDSRYDILRNQEDMYSESGNNSVSGLTGYSLLRYGNKTQLPVIWGMALELLKAQKNAFQRGCGLVVYEGYASKSACDLIAVSVRDNAGLDNYLGKGNLANGYAGGSHTSTDYAPFSSSYSKGTEVDVSIVSFTNYDSEGKEAVMQTKIHTLDFRSNLENNNDDANKLYDIMLNGTNLVPDDLKWWHFSLKADMNLYPKLGKYILGDYIV